MSCLDSVHCIFSFSQNIGIRLGELSRADPSVCGLILAGV